MSTLTCLVSHFPAASPVIVPGLPTPAVSDMCVIGQQCTRFSQQTAPPPSPSVERKHKCSCSPLKRPRQNTPTRRLLLAQLCAVQSSYQGVLFPAALVTQTSAILRQYWLALCGGGIMVIVSLPKSILLLSLKRPVPSAMIASSVRLSNHTDVLVDALLR